MNKNGYYNSHIAHKSFEYKYAQSILYQWKINNNYTCKCVVHHRDDTEETLQHIREVRSQQMKLIL